MALLRYMKPSRCLPDPKSSISVPSQPIAEANKEVQKAMQATKRGPYLQLSPSRCEKARNTPDTTEQQQQRGTTLETTSKLMADGVSVFLDSYCIPILYVSWLPFARKSFSYNSPPDCLVNVVATNAQISSILVLHDIAGSTCDSEPARTRE